MADEVVKTEEKMEQVKEETKDIVQEEQKEDAIPKNKLRI